VKVLNILVRRYLPLERFDAAVAFHETLIGQKARLRFDYREHGLRLAQVASILFVAGTEESLAPFVETQATFMVDAFKALRPICRPLARKCSSRRSRCRPAGTCWFAIPTACASSTSSIVTSIQPTDCPMPFIPSGSLPSIAARAPRSTRPARIKSAAT